MILSKAGGRANEGPPSGPNVLRCPFVGNVVYYHLHTGPVVHVYGVAGLAEPVHLVTSRS